MVGSFNIPLIPLLKYMLTIGYRSKVLFFEI